MSLFPLLPLLLLLMCSSGGGGGLGALLLSGFAYTRCQRCFGSSLLSYITTTYAYIHMCVCVGVFKYICIRISMYIYMYMCAYIYFWTVSILRESLKGKRGGIL